MLQLLKILAFGTSLDILFNVKEEFVNVLIPLQVFRGSRNTCTTSNICVYICICERLGIQTVVQLNVGKSNTFNIIYNSKNYGLHLTVLILEPIPFNLEYTMYFTGFIGLILMNFSGTIRKMHFISSDYAKSLSRN